MARHTITHADEIFAGAGVYFGANNSKRGISVELVHREIILNPAVADPNGYVAAAVTPLGDVTLNGALVTAGVGIADVSRGVQVVSSNAGDTTQTVTVTGTDFADQVIAEDLALSGTTPVLGLKAFKTVTAVSVDNLDVGTSGVLGLSNRLLNAYDVLHTLVASTGAADAGTVVVADVTSPVTNTTGDRRGTYDPAVVLDGIEDIVLYYVPDLSADGYGNNARS